MTTTKLTRAQTDVMLTLSNCVGRTVDVLTSQYDANVDADFRKRAYHLGSTTASTLKGLEAKGFIKVERSFWKGAVVTVLKGLDD